MRVAIYLLIASGLAGCAVAPLSTGVTGRALPKGDVEASSIIMSDGQKHPNIVPMGQIVYGLTGDTDIGVKSELHTFSVIVKHSLINSAQSDGFSLALLGSLITIDQDYSYYGGLVGSYLYQGIEPYMALRYNVVNFDPGAHDREFFSDPADLHFSFFSGALGFRYWLSAQVSVGTELIMLAPPTHDTKFSHPFLTALQFSFVF